MIVTWKIYDRAQTLFWAEVRQDIHRTDTAKLIILSEVSPKKDKYHMVTLKCGIQNTIQTNLSQKQNQSHTRGEQVCSFLAACRKERNGLGVWEEIATFRVNKQQGPTVEHTELHSASCDTFVYSKWVTLLLQQKLAQHCQPTILQ